ncbi:UNVERIFIED_CONTAM: hypothetical protein Slati_4481200 [Sesamum latifolium]|uniref:Phytocyanin domain-containing protein n=1 Tax=Sesamum latifolium TaxID=2727402 RepID=A0AAW2SRG6_9LAMI
MWIHLPPQLQREALAAKHAVGRSQGWDESVDFDSWVSARTFKVGDKLEIKNTSGLTAWLNWLVKAHTGAATSSVHWTR